jgi:hypothetical protein
MDYRSDILVCSVDEKIDGASVVFHGGMFH